MSNLVVCGSQDGLRWMGQCACVCSVCPGSVEATAGGIRMLRAAQSLRPNVIPNIEG